MATQTVKGTTIGLPNVDGGTFTAGSSVTVVYIQTKFGTVDGFDFNCLNNAEATDGHPTVGVSGGTVTLTGVLATRVYSWLATGHA